MEFNELLILVQDEPVFTTSFLLAGQVKPERIRLQLSRWVKSGKVFQLRRGVYALAPPYQKVKPHPFLVANQLQHASYVSGVSALAFYGLIPEIIHAVLSVGTGRPESLTTPLGDFLFRHVNKDILFGYRQVELMQGQSARIADPEKALLDLAYLQPGTDSEDFVAELRLQNTETLNLAKLHASATRFQSPKIRRFADLIVRYMEQEKEEYHNL